MIMLYYEIIQGATAKFNGDRYLSYLLTQPITHSIGVPRVAYFSERIWKWNKQTDQLSWVKNRHLGLLAPIDRKEFFLIQLAATEYVNDTIFKFYYK